MYYLKGHTPRSLHWDFIENPHEEMGLTIHVHFGWERDGSSHRLLYRDAEDFIRRYQLSWVVPSKYLWTVDLEDLKNHFPNLKNIDWLKGQVELRPEFERKEVVNKEWHSAKGYVDNKYVCVYFVLAVTPEYTSESIDVGLENKQMHTITGTIFNGISTWQLYPYSDGGKSEGLVIYFPIRPKVTSREAVDFVRRALSRESKPWLIPNRSSWLIDLNLLREWVASSQYPDFLVPLDWLKSDVTTVKAEVDFGRNWMFDRWEDQTEVRFHIDRGEYILNSSAKLFLSHKGADKPRVRGFSTVLKELGFDAWLDEDAMSAGTELHRGILQGFKDSCAAVFFITPNFKDEAYLRTEVNYAVQQKNEKSDRFAIITLVFHDEQGNKGVVPELLETYVWKEPSSDLEAFTEILRALPITVGPPSWRLGR